MNLIPLIPGDLTQHFPTALRWGVISGVNARHHAHCLHCDHYQDLVVFDSERLIFRQCLSCWLHAQGVLKDSVNQLELFDETLCP